MRLGVFTAPFRIFLIALALVSVGIVIVYSASGHYAANKERDAIARHAKATAVKQADTKISEYAKKKIGEAALENNFVYHSSYYAVRQIMWVGMGLLCLFVCYKIDYAKLKDAGPWLVFIAFVLLALVFAPGIGKTINKHRRWIGYGGFTFQPSEFAKLAMIIFMARVLTDHHKQIVVSFFKGTWWSLLLTGGCIGVIWLEPDIGAGAIIGAIVFLMLYIGGMPYRYLIGLGGGGLAALVFYILKFPDRVGRIIACWQPTTETRVKYGYQTLHSMIAVGSGGLWGKGIGESTQKYLLSEQFSDFVFAIVSEELGFVGAGIIILLYTLLIVEGWRVAYRAQDFYANLLASGITVMFAICAGLNLAMVAGMLPPKGLALPFISYGGSNMIITLASVGILMNVAKYVEKSEAMTAQKTLKTKPVKKNKWFVFRRQKKWFEAR